MKKLLYLAFIFFISVACEKEKTPELDFDFQFIDISYFPADSISMTFMIIPKGGSSPLNIKWNEPYDFNGMGPFTIKAKNNLVLDFEIRDNENTTKRFTNLLRTDTIDSLKYDYRNKYIGSYNCSVTYSYNGNNQYYTDTLTVEKNKDFGIIKISYTQLIYNQSNSFYGYHSYASFRNDSIYFSESGPLGYYYTYNYKGIKIK